MAIFDFYPKITYDNTSATNIVVGVEIIKQYLQDYTKFYTYTIQDGERADMIAYRVYGDSTLDWVLYLCNDILDPYKDWVMESKDFYNYLADKYNTDPYKLASTLSNDTIVYYYYTGLSSDSAADIAAVNYTLTPYTFDMLGSPGGWTPKSVWDYETEINESKRTINILQPVYLNNFKQQMKDLFING